MSPTLIGLHLGSHHSTISILNTATHTPELIANADGERYIPSIIAPHLHAVGSQAKLHYTRKPKACVKDPVGMLMTHAKTQIMVEREEGEGEDGVSAMEMTKQLLIHLRETAQQYIGSDIDGCVMSIPYTFSVEARELLLKAADEAKLHVYQLVHEPIAALAASTLQYKAKEDFATTVAVVDIGGSQSTVTLVRITNGIYTHLAHKTSTDIHGDKITQLLVDHFASDFLKRNPGLETMEGKPLRKLQDACEGVKKALSQTSTSTCYVESLHEGVDLHGSIMRMKFDMLGRSLWQQFAKLVETTISENGLKPQQINEVVFIGGGVRSPKVVSVIKSVFADDEDDENTVRPIFTVPSEPDCVTALGCGMQAALFTEEGVDEILEPYKYESPTMPTLTKAIKIDGKVVLVAGSPLPAHGSVTVSHGDTVVIAEEDTKLADLNLGSYKTSEIVIDVSTTGNVSLIITSGKEVTELKLF